MSGNSAFEAGRVGGASRGRAVAAADWYAQIDPGLPGRLLADVERVPKPKRTRPVRRARLHEFPYSLVFVELTDRIRVIAMPHMKRRPIYWLSRVPSDE